MFLLKLPRGNFRDIVHPDKLFTPQYLRYDILHFIIGFHVFVIIFCISINSMAYSPPLTPFSTINIISVNRSNFASFFFKALCHANPASTFKFIYYKRHIPKVLKYIELKLWYSRKFCISKSFKKFSLCACNLHQSHVPCLGD